MIVCLLALNLWISSRALSPNAPVRIPYSPTFLSQVQAGNVKEISSKGDSIQGTFKTKVRYPADAHIGIDETSRPRCRRSPTTSSSRDCCSSKGVTIDAKQPNSGPSSLTSIIVGFGPTLLLILLFVFIMRRAAAGGGGAGGLMSFGRSRARRVEASDQHVTFNDVAGIDEAKEELTEIVDFLKNPDKYLQAGRADPARGAAVRPAGNRQDAAGARGRRRGGGAVLSDVGVGVRRDDRRRRRLARA